MADGYASEAFKPLLDRDRAVKDAQPLAGIVTGILRERINFATKVYMACQEASIDEECVDFGIAMLYLHIIEMADAIGILLDQSSVTPISNALRLSLNF